MRWIRAISLRHFKRYRHIISVFSKYGLKEFASFVQAFRPISPATAPRAQKKVAENLRLALQDLGPTFIKGGQLLSSRGDLLPQVMIEELQKLLDHVEPVDFSLIRGLIEEEYREQMESVFNFVEEEPLASASLAQVHKAQLKNGQVVVLKVQRPGIARLISTDMDIFYDFAGALQDRISFLRAYNLSELVAEFDNDLKKELDFELEGQNMRIVANNMNEFEGFKIPEVFWRYTTKKILCLEFADGFKVTEKEKLAKAGVDINNLALKLLDIYNKQIYIDGFFQADPHVGNIIIREDGLVQIVDFGSIGKLDETMRKELANLFFNFIFKEGEQATETLLMMGKQKPHTNFGALKNDISALVADYATMPPQYFSIGRGFLELSRLAAKHSIEMPSAFTSVGRAFFLLDYLAKTLNPDFDYASYLLNFASVLLYERLASDYSPAKIAHNIVETSNLVSNFPSRLSFFLEKLLKDEFHVIFRHEGLERMTESLERAGFSIAISFTAAGFTFLGILMYLAKFIFAAYLLSFFAFILLAYLLYRMLRKVNWR